MDTSGLWRWLVPSTTNMKRWFVVLTLAYLFGFSMYSINYYRGTQSSSKPSVDKAVINGHRIKSPGGGTYELHLDRARQTGGENRYATWNGEHKSKTCKEKKKIVLLKTHKCASSTISNILIRYAMKHNLVIALPRYDEGHIGWPKSFQPEHIYRFSDMLVGNLSVDIIPHHLVYNRTALEQVMTNDTVYISIIREPFTQFKSTLSYFRKAIAQLGMPGSQKEAVTQFLMDADKYEKNVTFTFNDRPAGEKSITKNFMATEFGFPVPQYKDETFILDFLKIIEKEFHLVMLYEELYESVVLLRRLLCWDFKDILFTVVNKQYYRVERVTDSAMYRRHQKWSAVDHALYYHFRRILQIRKSSQGFRPLLLEAAHLRKVTYKLEQFCNVGDEAYLEIPATIWHLDFKVQRSQCGILNMYPHRLDEKLKKALDQRLHAKGIVKIDDDS